MSNQTNDFFSDDRNSTFDCGNYTFDVETGETTWHNETCGAVENDVTLSNITCGKQEYFSSTYAVVGTTVQVSISSTLYVRFFCANVVFLVAFWLC